MLIQRGAMALLPNTGCRRPLALECHRRTFRGDARNSQSIMAIDGDHHRFELMKSVGTLSLQLEKQIELCWWKRFDAVAIHSCTTFIVVDSSLYTFPTEVCFSVAVQHHHTGNSSCHGVGYMCLHVFGPLQRHNCNAQLVRFATRLLGIDDNRAVGFDCDRPPTGVEHAFNGLRSDRGYVETHVLVRFCHLDQCPPTATAQFARAADTLI